MDKKASFIKRIQAWGILLLLGFGLGLICIDVYQSYRDFHAKITEISREYHQRQRQIIRQEVMRVAEMIRYQRSQVENLTRNQIKSRVYEAHAIASRLYKESTLDPDMTRRLVVEALRSIRFAGGTGYYFATTLKGVEILFADRPHLEGRNLLAFHDTRGKHVVIDMIDIVTRNGEGFYEYHWTKPNSEGNDYKKISFVKRFDPWNGFIGTGLYVDDIEAREKAELLSAISRIRFGKEGYIFVNRFNGDALVSNGKVFSGKKKLWEVFPESPEKMKEIFAEEYDAIRKKEGDFIRYSHFKLTTPDQTAEKLSFIYGLKEFNWIIGAGVYLDDVEQEIAGMQAELNRNIRSKLINFTLIGTLFISLFFLFFNRMHQRLKEDLDFFILFFKQAATRDREIARDGIKFSEFDQVAAYANQMLTARKTAEKNYLMLFRQMLDGFALHEVVFNDSGDPADYRFLAVNPAFEAMTGLTADAILNRTVLEVLPDIEPYWIDTYGRVAVTGEPATFENYTAALDKYFQVTAFRPAPGQFACIFADITDQKRAEQESERLQSRLNQAQKMESIGNLAGGIAHDFNNILFPIIGMSELLMEDLSPDSTEYENAEEILRAGKRGAELVKQILAFSRQTEHKRIPVLPQQVLKEAIKLIRSTIPSTIRIQQHLQKDCGSIMADPTQIHQVAMNLITNAFHATGHGGGEITIVLREEDIGEGDMTEIQPGKFAVLSVTDTGSGIAPELKDKIFEPYFTTKQEGKGTGLGLSVVYGIVKEHGGHIRLDSQEGKGSVFTIYLPVVSMDARLPEDQGDHEYPAGTERILLVDDEASVLQIEKQMLQRLGYRVTSKASSLEALESFKADPDAFDLVLTDMTMPDMTGDRLAEQLIGIRPDIPIIVCTGFSESISRDTAEEVGIKGYLSKPVVWSELAEAVRKVLDDGGVADAPILRR